MSSATHEQKYADKSVYKGQWGSDGCRLGSGMLEYSNGTHYTGQFVGGMQHGHGVMVIPDSSNQKLSHKYEGEFANGNFSGYGIFTRSDGMKYEGQFKDGNITGYGLVTFKDGSNGVPRQEGRFDCGTLVEPRLCASEVQKAHESAEKARKS
jgi:hypothetical protein